MHKYRAFYKIAGDGDGDGVNRITYVTANDVSDAKEQTIEILQNLDLCRGCKRTLFWVEEVK